MIDARLARLLATLAAGLAVAGWLYLAHPDWFRDRSAYTLPVAASPTASPGPVIVPRATARPRPSPTPSTPRVGVTQHLDDIWVTPRRVATSAGAGGTLPNLGNEFLVVYLSIFNRSQIDYQVRQADFQVLDGQGEIDPPLAQDFTRLRLREVRLIPRGHIEGTLIFELPRRDPAARLLYSPDTLDPTKRKEWLLQ